MQLDGKSALVTGGGSGIGEAAARRLAREGAHVGVLGRTEDELEQVVKGIRKDGGKASVVLADVGKPQELHSAIKQFGDAQGHLEIVVANAGINGKWAPLEELTVEDYDETMNINLRGTFLTVKYALPYLKQQGGAVTVVASVNGTRMFSNTGATIYACTKAGQVAFVKMTAIELANYAVRINVICPGAIETEISDNTEQQNLDKIKYPQELPKGEIPLTKGKPGTSEQVADLILFLSSDASSHITGTEVWIDGGESLLRG